MNYTQAQIDRANAVSLEDFLCTQGETLYPLWKADDYTGQPRRGQDLLCHASCGGLYQPKAFTRYGDP